MSKLISQPREIYYNPVQMKVNTINARNTILIGGRALGKTTGIHGPRTSSCLVKMPGSSNAFISRTYKQFKTRILGSLVSGWKDLGFEEFNEKTGKGHFMIGKKNKLWPSPQYAIGDYTQAIHWFTGAVIVLISQDRAGDANGSNIQSLHGDEAFQLDKEDLDENVIPALRGLPVFSTLSEYRSITLTTSMPLTPDAAWIFDYAKETDPEINEYIMQVYGAWYKLYMKILNEKDQFTERTLQTYQMQLKKLDFLLNDLRTDYTYYLEADSFENYHVLGEKYFRTQRRILSQEKWETQIENKRPAGITPGKRFYPQLNTKHFYIDYNNPFFDQFIYLPEDKDTCLGDADCNRHQPLEISLDFGGRINSMTVWQDKLDKDEMCTLKEFFAEQPEYLQHLIERFNKYYQAMDCRKLIVYYDVNGKKHIAQSDQTDIQSVQRMLVDHGWDVELVDIDTNPMHDDKFEFINLMLSEQDRRLPKWRIHEANCPNLKIALFNAPLKINERGRKVKNKNSERMESKTPQTQATHITDTCDYILFRKYRPRIEEAVTGYGTTIFG
jgi:uncharacterized protein YpiB (UPF0302 family)